MQVDMLGLMICAIILAQSGISRKIQQIALVARFNALIVQTFLQIVQVV